MNTNNETIDNLDKNDRKTSRTWYTSGGNANQSCILENFDKYFDKETNMHDFFLPQYEQCKVYKPNSGTWLFEWYNIHPKYNKLKRIRKTFGINRIRAKAERERVAQNIVRHLNKMLAHGWNYFVHEMGIESHISNPYNPTVKEALKEALKQRKMGKKKRTVESYDSFVNIFCNWIDENNYTELPIKAFKYQIFNNYIAERLKAGYSNRNANDHINFFKTTFDVIVDSEVLATNPLKKVKFLPKVESSKFNIISDENLRRIALSIKAYNINYYLATKFLSDLYIRPGHWGDLKNTFIDFKKKTITLPGTITKNRRNNTKQLFPEIIALLKKLKIDQLDGEWYIFGRDFEPSRKKHNRINKDASELWHKIVIDGLGLNHYLYELKHTSVTYFVNENDDIDSGWLKQQMEHRTIAQTETYIIERKQKTIDASKIKRIKY